MNCRDESIVVIDDDYSVKMIWHDDEFIRSDITIFIRNIVPTLYDDLSEPIGFHFRVDDLAE